MNKTMKKLMMFTLVALSTVQIWPINFDGVSKPAKIVIVSAVYTLAFTPVAYCLARGFVAIKDAYTPDKTIESICTSSDLEFAQAKQGVLNHRSALRWIALPLAYVAGYIAYIAHKEIS